MRARFEPREVKLGAIGGPDNDLVHIISGLEAGDRVVTSAQFLIDSESRLQEAIQKMRAPQSQEDTMNIMESESDSAMPSGEMDHSEMDHSQMEIKSALLDSTVVEHDHD